jgi:hypothetical protein
MPRRSLRIGRLPPVILSFYREMSVTIDGARPAEFNHRSDY